MEYNASLQILKVKFWMCSLSPLRKKKKRNSYELFSDLSYLLQWNNILCYYDIDQELFMQNYH